MLKWNEVISLNFRIQSQESLTLITCNKSELTSRQGSYLKLQQTKRAHCKNCITWRKYRRYELTNWFHTKENWYFIRIVKGKIEPHISIAIRSKEASIRKLVIK